MDQRLQKILSAGGVCSRRKAEEYLREGRVTVNGVPAALGDKADPETDTIARERMPLLLRQPGRRPRGADGDADAAHAL